MKKRDFLYMLCAVAMFVTQIVAVAHATQHELATATDVHCDLCAVAHAAPMPPAPAQVPVQISFNNLFVAPAHAGPIDRRPFDPPHSRGPPSLLARS